MNNLNKTEEESEQNFSKVTLHDHIRATGILITILGITALFGYAIAYEDKVIGWIILTIIGFILSLFIYQVALHPTGDGDDYC